MAVFDENGNVYSFAMSEDDRGFYYTALHMPRGHTGKIIWSIKNAPLITSNRASVTAVTLIPNPDDKRLMRAAKGAYIILYHNFSEEDLVGAKLYRNGTIYDGALDGNYFTREPHETTYVLTYAATGDRMKLQLADGSEYEVNLYSL